MKSQQPITISAIFILMLAISVVLFTACGDTERQADLDGNSDSDLGVSPGTEQQMENNHKEDQEETFEATLEGNNEIPEVDTEASGSVTATLRGDSLHVQGDFSNLSADYTASHIHTGTESENGDPIITLKPTVGNDGKSGSWNASYTLDEQQIQALKNDSLYINVHTTEHQSGEIRGQLTSSMLE